MNYNEYSVFDFLRDENFQQWIKTPDPASDSFWHAWIQDHPEKKEAIEEAREILQSIRFQEKPASQKIEERILNNVMRHKYSHLPEKRSIYSSRRTFYIAASVLIIALAGAWLFVYNSDYSQLDEKNVQVSQLLKESPNGSKVSFQLSDGSKIKLNAGSQLKTKSDFDGHTREVFLQGEAYFEVEKDTTKPFMIHTGNLTTLVKGTAFNIAAYDDEGDIRVAVTEGKVAVILKNGNEIDTLHLIPSDMLTYNKSTTDFQKIAFDARKEIGWKDGIIYFDNASCTEIFPYLEKWYGVQINVENPEKILESFVGEFDNENLENVLHAMGIALRFDYEIENKTVHIKPK